MKSDVFIKNLLRDLNIYHWNEKTEKKNEVLTLLCGNDSFDFDRVVFQVLEYFNLNITERNTQRLLLPPYSTEKDFDFLLHALSEKFPAAIDPYADLTAVYIKKNYSFDSFIISMHTMPQMRERMGMDEIRANLYTQFVFREILKTDADYFDTMMHAFQIGSKPELIPLLENINNGDSRTTTEQLRYLQDENVPYLAQYYNHVCGKVYNIVNKLHHDMSRALNRSESPSEYMQQLASRIVNNTILSINTRSYRILSVEGLFHSPEMPDENVLRLLDGRNSGARWIITDNGVYISFCSKDKTVLGALLISEMEDVKIGVCYFCYDIREIFQNRIEHDILEETLPVKLVEAENLSECEILTQQRCYIPDLQGRELLPTEPEYRFCSLDCEEKMVAQLIGEL